MEAGGELRQLCAFFLQGHDAFCAEVFPALDADIGTVNKSEPV